MTNSYQAIVIGASAGGIEALSTILSGLPNRFYPPIVIVEHVGNNDITPLIHCLADCSNITIEEATPNEIIYPNTIYIAPSGYHLLIEENKHFSLSVDPEVNYARPSIDVLFESAADAYKNRIVAILLSGANSDGTEGLLAIKNVGGFTIAQSPETAAIATMPQSAINANAAELVLPLDKIAPYLMSLPFTDAAE